MNKILTIAALALVLSACSNEDNDIQTPVEQPAKSEGIPFTATISIGESAMTRALTEDATNNQIVPTWATGEKVALIYTVGSTPTKTDAEVTKQADGTATISATLASGATNGSDVTIIYPSTAADGTTGNVKANLLAAQDGTLATISANYDVRKGTGKLSINDEKATVNNGTAGTTVSLTNLNAIFKFTLQDLSAGAKSATEFKVSDGSGNVMTTVTLGSASDVLYVVLPAMAKGTYWFNATIDSKPYIAKATTAAATVAGKYYQTTVKMATIGDVILSDGKFAVAGTSGAVTKICYVGGDNGEAAPYNHGLALALSDANGGISCKWKTSQTDAGHAKQSSSTFTEESGLQYNDATHISDTYPAFKAAITYTYSPAAPTGCSAWFLASGYQWQKMIGAAGVSNLGLQNTFYWSSTEGSASNAWLFSSQSGGWYNDKKDNVGRVRACLAF